MAKKIILPSIRIDEQTEKNMQRAIKDYNSNQNIITPLNEQTFRRMAYEQLAQRILKKLPLDVKLI
jgi:hypothetical protein